MTQWLLKDILDVFAGLFDAGLGLVVFAFGGPLVVGWVVAAGLFRLTGEVFSGVFDLVCCAHDELLFSV
jgi:hypothetical protein